MRKYIIIVSVLWTIKASAGLIWLDNGSVVTGTPLCLSNHVFKIERNDGVTQSVHAIDIQYAQLYPVEFPLYVQEAMRAASDLHNVIDVITQKAVEAGIDFKIEIGDNVSISCPPHVKELVANPPTVTGNAPTKNTPSLPLATKDSFPQTTRLCQSLYDKMIIAAEQVQKIESVLAGTNQGGRPLCITWSGNSEPSTIVSQGYNAVFCKTRYRNVEVQMWQMDEKDQWLVWPSLGITALQRAKSSYCCACSNYWYATNQVSTGNFWYDGWTNKATVLQKQADDDAFTERVNKRIEAKTKPNPKPEKSSSGSVDIKASIKSNLGFLTVRNKDDFDWTNVVIEINGGIFSGGYKRKITEGIPAGTLRSYVLSSFTKPDGEKFNPSTYVVKKITISCETKNGQGFGGYGE